MGCTVKEKIVRTNSKKGRSKQAAYRTPLTRVEVTRSIINASLDSFYARDDDLTLLNPNSKPDDAGWGFCNEDQLKEILMKNLEVVYHEAISKLIALGYDEPLVLRALLRNGHCYGGLDALSNILHNSLAYLNCSRLVNNENSEESDPLFTDLTHLEEYSLACMVCLIQQVRPHLSKGDAMWCLLMSDLHVGRASALEIPALHPPLPPCNGCGPPPTTTSNMIESVSDSSPGGGSSMVPPPGLCKFNSGWGFGAGGSVFPVNGVSPDGGDAAAGLLRDVECPKRFNLTPPMKSLLKRNVAMFAAEFRANSKKIQTQSQACSSSVSGGKPSSGPKQPVEQNEDSRNAKNPDSVDSVLNKFSDLDMGECLSSLGEDQKDEMLLSLTHQVKDLEKQVGDRKEWAHQKAMQAARKLSADFTELKMLRMERDETQRLKKGKPNVEDITVKRLAEMENALRNAGAQVDNANGAVKKLEIKNAEIRAEMEASKLSAAESVRICLEVSKREKKCLKKILAWEKQKSKLQGEIADETRQISELQKQFLQYDQAQKESEDKLIQEVKLKEEAAAQVEEERRLKEAAEASSKRKQEALHLKIEIDFQRHKDDIQRLEHELAHLKASTQVTEPYKPIQLSKSSKLGKSEEARLSGETISRLLNELENLQISSENAVGCNDRKCLVCRKDEVSVVFLPCAHQILCANCSENHGKKNKAACPCCRVPIEQRIRVFGAAS